jgi:hypothetical protein
MKYLTLFIELESVTAEAALITHTSLLGQELLLCPVFIQNGIVTNLSTGDKGF